MAAVSSCELVSEIILYAGAVIIEVFGGGRSLGSALGLSRLAQPEAVIMKLFGSVEFFKPFERRIVLGCSATNTSC